MLRTTFIVAALSFLSGWALLASAESANFSRDELLKQWSYRRDLRSLGEDKLGLAGLAAVHKSQITLGIRSLPEFSHALLREAEIELSQDNRQGAVDLIYFANRFSPDLLEPHFAYLRLFMSGKLFGKVTTKVTVGETLSQIRNILTHSPTTLLAWKMNGILWLKICLQIFLSLLLASAVLRNFGLRLHSFEHWIPLKLDSLVWAIGILLLAIACWLAAGPLALAPLAVFLFWRFFSKIELGFLVAAALLLTLLPFALQKLSPSLKLAVSPKMALIGTDVGLSMEAKVPQIEKLLQSEPKNPWALFAMGNHHRLAGRQTEAKAFYSQALGETPFLAPAQMNLANILFNEKDAAQAIALYKDLLRKQPRSFLANYNLGKIFYNEAELEEGNRLLKTAKQIDAVAFEQFENSAKLITESGSYLFMASVTSDDLFRLSPMSAHDKVNSADVWPSASLLFFSLFFGILHLFRKPPVNANGCNKCGSIYCEQCEGILGGHELCPQCYNIYIRKVTLDPEIKILKERQIRRFQFRQRLLSFTPSLLFPGLGSLYRRRYGVGLTIMLSTLLILVPLLPLAWIATAAPLIIPGARLLAISSLVLLYVLGIVHGVRS